MLGNAKLTEAEAFRRSPNDGSDMRAKLYWTLGNLAMLIGIVLLLYVGGLYTQAAYGRYAARGDTEAPAPAILADALNAEPAPFSVPALIATSGGGQVVGTVPDVARVIHQSTVTRLVIPSINVDSKVVEVGWEIGEQNGQQVAIWQVAKYAVGQHKGSANPGSGDNIVLAGHVGGYGKVFKDLYYVKPGDQITIYSAGQQYLYTVQERLVLQEEGVSSEQRAANARYIAPTGNEVVTLVTCWPATGPDKFTQRVVVRAVPFNAGEATQPFTQYSWTVR